MNETLAFDPQEYQNMLMQAIGQAYRSHAPSWLDSLVFFIQAHPWLSIGIAVFAVFFISAVVRELLCQYFKTSEILERIKKLEQHLGKE